MLTFGRYVFRGLFVAFAILAAASAVYVGLYSLGPWWEGSEPDLAAIMFFLGSFVCFGSLAVFLRTVDRHLGFLRPVDPSARQRTNGSSIAIAGFASLAAIVGAGQLCISFPTEVVDFFRIGAETDIPEVLYSKFWTFGALTALTFSAFLALGLVRLVGVRRKYVGSESKSKDKALRSLYFDIFLLTVVLWGIVSIGIEEATQVSPLSLREFGWDIMSIPFGIRGAGGSLLRGILWSLVAVHTVTVLGKEVTDGSLASPHVMGQLDSE